MEGLDPSAPFDRAAPFLGLLSAAWRTTCCRRVDDGDGRRREGRNVLDGRFWVTRDFFHWCGEARFTRALTARHERRIALFFFSLEILICCFCGRGEAAFFLALNLTFTCGIGVFLSGWANFSFGSRLPFEGERQPVALGYQVSGVVKSFPESLESPKTEGSTVPSCEIQ